MGIDIIQNCEVKNIKTDNHKVEGVETSKDLSKQTKLQ